MKKTGRRIISILLSIAMVMSYLPSAMVKMDAATRQTINRVADPSNMDGWKDFFLPEDGTISTENAGGVWTNKSVFTDATAFTGTNITMADTNDNFLVALSAIASNMTITGMSSVPTDTMFVLDVSGSMNNNQGNNNVAAELVEAANASLAALLDANKYNRVGVVLYSGPTNVSGAASANDAVLILPLNRYTTGTDDKYLSYTLDGGDEYIGIDSSTRVESTSAKPTSRSKEVVGATYIQKGVLLAKDQFTATANETTVTDEAIGTVKRKPIMVLMSDGAPTVADTDFTNPGSYDLGDGQAKHTSAAQGFVTQLSAAYAKQQIEEKYENECLFYTMGLGVSNSSVARSVLNPSASSTAISNLWKTYNSRAVGGSVTVETENGSTKRVTKIAEPLEQTYVDKYFDSDDYTGGLAAALKQAFADIVDDIQLQSKYFPTLIQGSEELSGYISFVDNVGKYMKVTDVKGIMIHDDLFSGADLASNFVEGGGALGTVENPTALGDEMVWAVMARLGLETADQARTLIGLAYQYGQLSYTSKTEFSNYIGWYANAAGKFLGFWHEGISTMPNPADPNLTDETRPVYIMKSYGYLGEVDETHGVTKSDMMYATVQVRERIADGEQMVSFAVPAALIPVITYEVSLGEDGNVKDLKATGAKNPIRLVYEVALDERINEYTLNEIVSPEYLAANTNADGSVNFYSNQFEADNTTGYGKVNPYSYFRPSRQNDRYYYQNDALVYTDTAGTLYKGDTKPAGTMYHAYTVYKADGTSYTKDVVYHQLTAEALETAQRTTNDADTTWYIAQGTVRRDYAGFQMTKSENTTGTLPFSDAPFTDIEGHNVNDTDHSFVFGATLGNNGRLRMVPETGIRLSKQLATDAVATDKTFVFKLTNTSNLNDGTAYPTYKVAADRTVTEGMLTFTNGTATVELKADDVIYIGGMTVGDAIKVEEVETADHIVESVNGNKNAKDAVVVIQKNVLGEAAFENADRGKGNLTIAKEVEHDFGTAYQIPADKEFTMNVTLTGIGTANATFEAKQTNKTLTSITTDVNGKFTVTLKHNEQLELFGLPEGTQATVAEEAPGTGFEAQYWDNGLPGDGNVAVMADNTVSVIVVNDYTATRVYPVNITVEGTKTLNGRDWTADDEFTFRLEKQQADGSWVQLGDKVKADKDNKNFNFNNAFANEEYTTIGTYAYRVIEEEPVNPIAGVSYDKTVHGFAVDVTDEDMDGKLEIKAVRAYRDTTIVTQPTANNWNVKTSFVNNYEANATEATIEINKTVDNKSLSPLATLNGFKFEVYKYTMDGNNVVLGEKIATSLETTDTGTTKVVLPKFTEEGIYKFAVKEIKGNKKGWTYNETPVLVVVNVTDDGNGNLIAKAAVGTEETDIPATATSMATVVIENTYDPGTAYLAVDFVNKELTGKALEGFDFTFEVHRYISDAQTTAPMMIGTNDKTGKVSFGNQKLTFTEVGTYFFQIKETSPDENGITTDKTIYRIAVTVIDNNGTLEASYTLVNAEGNKITFKNTYNANPRGYAINGNKVLRGRELLNDEFTFVLTEAKNANGEVAEGAKTYEATNFADGTFTFPEITYTAAGDYYYVVTEKTNGGADFGIQYDKTEYIVKVTVEDNMLGNLVIKDGKPTYTIKGNGTANAIVFENKYVPNPAKAVIDGIKTFEGKDLQGNDFEFELYRANNDWNPEEKLDTVANAKDGTFKFKELEFAAAGTYYYLVREVNGGTVKDGVTYDDEVFRVRIDVTDNLRGQLNAEVSVFDADDIPQENVQFGNVYTVTGSDHITLKGEKTLKNRELQNEEFSFELYQTDNTFKVTEKAIDTVKNQGKDILFNLEYNSDQLGETFYYVVKEVNGGNVKDGVKYSNKVYHVTVEIQDNGKGGIKAVKTIKDGAKKVENIDFENVFEVNPPKEPKTQKVPTAPKTGDNNNNFLWFALLFVSGGIVATTVVYKEKKKKA